VKKSRVHSTVEQVVHYDVLLAVLHQGEGALPLDVGHERVNVYPALHLHLLQHGIHQDVEAGRTSATAEIQKDNFVETIIS